MATKSVALCCLLLIAAGCSQQPQQKAAEQVTVTERSPEQICASADNLQSVKAIIVREAKEEAPGSETVGDEVLASYLTIGPVVVELVDEATDRVTCSTDLSFSVPADLRGYYVQAAILANYLQRNGHAAWAASNGVDMGEEVPGELMKGNGGAVPISFSVQPTADRKSELVSVEGAGGLISAVATAARAAKVREQAVQASAAGADARPGAEVDRPSKVLLEKVDGEGVYYDEWFGALVSAGPQTDVRITGEGKDASFTGVFSFNCEPGGKAYWKSATSFVDSVLLPNGELDPSHHGALPSERTLSAARSKFCPAS